MEGRALAGTIATLVLGGLLLATSSRALAACRVEPVPGSEAYLLEGCRVQILDAAGDLRGLDPPQEDAIFVSDENGDGDFADDINATIDSCGSASSPGCTIVLPRGVLRLEAPITVGGLLANEDSKSGVILRGHGAGRESLGQHHPAGTTLAYDGPAGLNVLNVHGVRESRFEDFAIDCDLGDGDGNRAAWGIEVSSNVDVFAPGQNNVFDNISVFDCSAGGSRIADFQGSRAGDQNDNMAFLNMSWQDVPVCFRQDVPNADQTLIQNSRCRAFDNVGFSIRNGGALIQGNLITAPKAGDPRAPSEAGISIGDRADEVVIISNALEMNTGDGIITWGTTRRVPSTIMGNFISNGQTGADCVRYQHGGALAFTGNQCGRMGGVSRTDLVIQNRAGGPPLELLLQGNRIVGGTGGIDRSGNHPAGRTRPVAHRRPLHQPGHRRSGSPVRRSRLRWREGGRGGVPRRRLDRVHACPSEPNEGGGSTGPPPSTPPRAGRATGDRSRSRSPSDSRCPPGPGSRA